MGILDTEVLLRMKIRIVGLLMCGMVIGCQTDQGRPEPIPTKDSYEPLLTLQGDTVLTGVDLPLVTRKVPVGAVMSITKVPAGDPVIIPAHPTRVDFDEMEKKVFPIDQQGFQGLSSGDIINPRPLVNMTGDTVPTGIAIPAEGKTMEVSWTKPRQALPPKYLDKAELDIKFLDVEHGLSSSFVHSVIKDRRGHLWAGTYGGGISVYDGITFRHFSVQEGLPSSIVLKLLEDKDGRIWIGGITGLAYFDGQELVQFRDEDGFASSSINSMLLDDEGNIWFGSMQYGLSKFDGQSLVYYGEKEGCKARQITCLEMDRDGNLWIGDFDEGLIKFDGERFINFSDEVGLPPAAYRAIHRDLQGSLWFGTVSSGVLIYRDEEVTQLTDDYFLLVEEITSDRFGNIWMGTVSNGLLMYDGQYVTGIGEEVGLNHRGVRGIFVDEFGKVWMASYGGLSVYNPYSLRHPSTLAGKLFSAVFKDSRGHIWLGTDTDGVFKYDGSNFLHFPQELGLANADINITQITEDSQGNIWFGASSYESAYSSLVKYDGHVNRDKPTFTHYRRAEAESNVLISIDEFDRLWVVYEGMDVLSFDGDSLLQLAMGGSTDANRPYYSVLTDGNGDIWLRAQGGGLTKIALDSVHGAPTTYTHYAAGEGLTNDLIAGIVADNRGGIWARDFYGNIYVNDGAEVVQPFRQYYLPEKGDGQYVFSLVPEGDKMWAMLASNDGLELRTIDGPDNGGGAPSVSMGIQDGLKTFSFFGHGLVDGDSIWLSTNKGISLLDLRHFGDELPGPILSISEIEVGDQHQDYRIARDSLQEYLEFGGIPPFSNVPPDLQLNHDQNDMTFHFTAIEWSAPHQIRYSYKLDGADQDWSDPDPMASASFQRLPHGNYTLLVRAYGRSGLWGETLAYSFNIHPPWWLTWWAKGFYVAMAALVIVGIVRLRTTNLKRRSKNLEEIVQERTIALQGTIKQLRDAQSQLIHSEKMASLGQLTAGIAHEINNPINFVHMSSDAMEQDIQDLLRLLEMYRNQAQSRSGDPDKIEAFEAEIDYQGLIAALRREVTDIREGSRRTSEIVQSLGEFSRGMQSPKELADIHYGIDSTLSLLRNRTKQGVAIEKHYDPMMEPLLCNAGQLNQVFMNLLTNAIDAAGSNGTIQIVTKNAEEDVRISVIDDGPGIPIEIIDKVFDPFFTTKEVGEGTGLGLSISHKIIADHGGSITAENDKGRGTVFAIRLPKDQAPAPGQEGSHDSSAG